MNIIKKTCLINLLFLMTIVGFGLYPSLSNAQPDIVSVDPLTHKLNRTNFVGSVAVFKGLYIGTNEVLTTGASSINTLATTNFVIGTSNGLWTATTNLVTRSTNTIWIATTNLVTSSIANITPASIGAVSNTPLGIANAGGLTNAWQNPASATNWTWSSDGTQITLTGYTGPNDVVIPDMLDGLPVTGFGLALNPTELGSSITSVTGGINIKELAVNAFYKCSQLILVSLSSVTNVGESAFSDCAVLSTVLLPSALSFGDDAFAVSPSLGFFYAPVVRRFNTRVFNDCTALTNITYASSPPTVGANVFLGIPAGALTNYVTSPTATGWGATLGGRPVVRLPVYADEYWRLGTNLTTLLADKVTKSPITNEFSIPFVTTIPTNSPFLLARLNESQILTQLMSKAQSGSGATATVYVLPTFQSDFSAATSTNDILINSSWNTTNISFTIPIGGGLAIAVTSGYLNITNTIILIRTVIP